MCRASSETLSERRRFGFEFCAWYNEINHPDVFRLLCAKPIAQEGDFHGLLDTHCARQVERGRAVWARADLAVSEREKGILRSNNEIASKRHTHAGTGSRAAAARYNRFWHASHGEHNWVQVM